MMTDERQEREHESQSQTPSRARPSRQVIAVLVLVITALSLIRIPFILFGPGMQDEQWFAGKSLVPGAETLRVVELRHVDNLLLAGHHLQRGRLVAPIPETNQFA